jgi:hypothetical protein
MACSKRLQPYRHMLRPLTFIDVGYLYGISQSHHRMTLVQGPVFARMNKVPKQ